LSIPEYFALNDRPVKIVMHPGGGFDAMTLDMSTGKWVDGTEQLDRYFRQDGEIELLTAREFDTRVSEIRKRLGVPE
jgi:hypothetical protein